MATAADLLVAYDEQLRTEAEVLDAVAVEPLGPLLLAKFRGGRGFVTYRGLGEVASEDLHRLLKSVVAHYAVDPEIVTVEWKTRGHDPYPLLHAALLANGFEPGEQESVMVGPARSLIADSALPAGVSLRRVTREDDVRAMSAMVDEVFGRSVSSARADALVQRLACADGFEVWVAEFDGSVISAGRLEAVPDSDFASIWGGVTRPAWRRQGIYRALTAARARSALQQGKTLLHSDSTEYSRPILERSGLLKVSTTTPYQWQR